MQVQPNNHAIGDDKMIQILRLKKSVSYLKNEDTVREYRSISITQIGSYWTVCNNLLFNFVYPKSFRKDVKMLHAKHISLKKFNLS